METPIILEKQQALPWVRTLVNLIEQQARTIQEQAQTIQKQTEEITVLKVTAQELRDEIARLKKTPKRPKFRGGKGPDEKKRNRERGGGVMPPVVAAVEKVKEEIVVKVENVPEGSRFKGHAHYTVQEMEVIVKEILYKLEIWQAPDGSMIRADLPKEVEGTHFGPMLHTLMHGLYASGVTQPELCRFIRSLGIEISEGQIHNMLVGEAKGYEAASEAILETGLQEAPYIRTDDTGAKHCYKTGYCTHIGGQYFSYYKTTTSKSRMNFLKMLAQGKEGYLVNDACIWHLFCSGCSDDILNAFEEYRGKCCRTQRGWNRFLDELGLGNKKLREACLEAGLIGFIEKNRLRPGQVLLSDRAGQFAILNHAACWLHMERPLRKLPASTPEVEEEIRKVRDVIWSLYDMVKAASLSQEGRKQVEEAYDALVAMPTISPGVKAVLNSFREYRSELLKALDYPGLPLHNNDSERDIRGVVKFRNVSGSTKSEEGKAFRDGLMTLKQTCYRLGKNFWEYLKAWFLRTPPDLSELVRERYRTPA